MTMTTTPLPDRLRALQAQQGKTNAEMAAAFRIARDTWMKWKAGKHAPRGPMKQFVQGRLKRAGL